MTSLLDLPDELIFDIVGLALSTSPIRIPPDAKRHRHGHDTKVCYIDSNVAYQPNGLALLLVCKQLNAQIALYISKTPRICELDIAVINVVDFLPTWRYIPTRNGSAPAMLDRVVVNLTPCCTTGKFSKLRKNWPTRYLGNINEQLWMERLLTVIQQYFAVGAVGKNSKTIIRAMERIPHGRSGISTPIRTRTLVINADTPKQPEATLELGEIVIPARQVGDHPYPSYYTLFPISATEITKMVEWIASRIDRRLRFMSNIHSCSS